MRTHDLTTVQGILSALDINPEWPIDRREQAIKLECANYNALVEIASALNCESPSTLDHVSGIVSAVWTLKHKSSEVGAVARHDGDLVEALRADLATKDASLKTANARAERAQAALAEMVNALDDAGAPKVYDLPDDTERPIPDPERIRLLGERVRGEHAERIREGDRAQIYRDRLAAADLALDDRDAPRHADGSPLSIAARIRALPH